MRVIQLISGGGQGGADQVALALGQSLRAAGHEAVFAVCGTFAELHKLALTGHATWVITRFRGLPLGELRRFNHQAATADLVLTHDSGARHFALLAKGLGLRPPIWFMRHCISGTTRFGGVQLHRLLVAHHIAVSDVIRNNLLADGFPGTSVSRIYGAVNLESFQHPDEAVVQQRRAEMLDALAPGSMVVGIVARMDAGRKWRVDQPDGKGYDVLFRALARLPFPYRVLVLGPGSARAFEALRQMAAFHGARPECLRFAGFVADISSYYPLMHVNVLPSRSEGLGLALVEGMAAGIPSVGSRSGGIPEIIEHERTGLLFDEGDDAALAACLGRLHNDQDFRTRLAQAGQAAVLARFSATAMTRDFCELASRRGISMAAQTPAVARVRPAKGSASL